MRTRPALVTVGSFSLLVLAGAIALQVTGSASARGRGLVDAAFMATSATCVTGLTVVDLERQVPVTGQVILLVLLQVGGLGLMTLSNWVLLALRRRLDLGGAVLTRETYGGIPQLTPRQILGHVFLFTALTEAVGTALLYLRFVQDAPPATALWHAGFHSASAFCNAGLSLFSTNLAAYRSEPFVNVVVMALIVAGGLGFVVAADLMGWLRARMAARRRRLAYHSRVVLVATAILIVAGAALVLAFEWGNPCRDDAVLGRVVESFFLSVTSRTAGFNTVDIGHLTNTTLLVVILLMVVGASPGSTGGGIKTTSMAIIWARTRSHLLNRPDTELLGYRVARQLAAKSMAVLILYLLTVLVAMAALQLTESGGLPHHETRGDSLEQLFEVVSALSTVGLSTGITTSLSDGGLVVLMLCMFVGRVGPLVLAASVVGERARLPYAHPEGDVMVG